METIHNFLHFLRHVDPQTLAEFLRPYGPWAYAVLFAIIFCETGLVVTPFLPGDSLLFAAGALSATGTLKPLFLFLLLAGAAIVGDNVNYWFGRFIGPRAFSGEYRFLKKKHLDRTHEFYEKHGPVAVILARFVPIVRTFAPFVAGVGAMRLSQIPGVRHGRRHRLGWAFYRRRLLLRHLVLGAKELPRGDRGHYRDFGSANRRGGGADEAAQGIRREIRNPKLGIRNKSKTGRDQDPNRDVVSVLVIPVLSFEFVSDFALRIFPLPPPGRHGPALFPPAIAPVFGLRYNS